MTRAARVRVTGGVQGVGFRDWTRRAALALGLAGWVRNRRDGSVEAQFSGPEAAVADMLARCRVGPRAATVTAVAETPADADLPDPFEIRPTA